MMSGFEVTCANKDHRGVIVRLGGEGWSMPAREAVVKLISHQVRLFLRVDEHLFDLGVRGEGFSAYLVLEPEGVALQDVQGLPSC